MKRCNPRLGCRKIVQQISMVFGTDPNKDVGRRTLARFYSAVSGTMVLRAHRHWAHKGSLWGVDPLVAYQSCSKAIGSWRSWCFHPAALVALARSVRRRVPSHIGYGDTGRNSASLVCSHALAGVLPRRIER